MNSPSFDKLLAAMKRDDCEGVQELLDGGFNPNTEDANGCTALILAAQHQKPRIVRLLLQSGANAAHRDHEGYDVVRTANWHGEYRMGAYTKESQEIIAIVKQHQAGTPESPDQGQST